MKSFLFLLTFATGSLLLFSCSTTSDAYQDEQVQESNENQPYYTSLADVLRREGGLVVRGSGNSAKVNIRGTNTFKLTTEPLFVIDGVPIGNSYSQANTAVNANNIADVSVIKSANAMTLYGERSRNGVILIKTKQGKNLEKEKEKGKESSENNN